MTDDLVKRLREMRGPNVWEAADRIESLEQVRDHAYHERNRLAAFLSHLYPSGIKATNIPGWDKEWHGCVYIDLPTGQVSWHYHEREAHFFSHLPPYEKEWDGHSSEEKYDRLSRAALPDMSVKSLYRRCQRANDRIRELEAALTPSGTTKAAYIGEFKFKISQRREVMVPWTTIKEIMAAIMANAALEKKDD